MTLPLLFFGITGGIASGKSTVARRFRERGVPVIDADVVAREVVVPGSQGLDLVVQTFGSGLLNDDGTLNRRALADMVFNDQASLDKLDEILGPLIRLTIAFQASDFQKEGHEVVGCEAAVLIEKGWTEFYRPIVLVSAPEASQVQRGVVRDSSTEDRIRARMKFQLPLEEKRKVADYIIENDADLSTLIERTDKVIDTLLTLVEWL